MGDAGLRDLERAAAGGDAEAQRALLIEHLRRSDAPRVGPFVLPKASPGLPVCLGEGDPPLRRLDLDRGLDVALVVHSLERVRALPPFAVLLAEEAALERTGRPEWAPWRLHEHPLLALFSSEWLDGPCLIEDGSWAAPPIERLQGVTALADLFASAHVLGVSVGRLDSVQYTHGRLRVRRRMPFPVDLEPPPLHSAAMSAKDQAWRSPEATSGRRETLRADVWTLGVALFMALTGRHPFARESTLPTVMAILRDPISPRAHLPDVDPALERVCLRALAREPSDRYPDALACAADLERARGGDPIEAP